ncbi:hypothetical protein E4K10_39320 [Streptomyces sp. T1317-0309]|nr:hypothetical protein E4K10_39320 [Streptomyces sp. T1317-0309]
MATLLLLTVGNSTSGATVGPDLLPGVARSVSALLPPAPPSVPSPMSATSTAHMCSPPWRHSPCGPWGRTSPGGPYPPRGAGHPADGGSSRLLSLSEPAGQRHAPW